LTIIATGDILLHENLWYQAAADAAARGRPGYDFGPPIADVADEIAAADLAVCHLETPLGEPGGPFTGYPLFTVPPQIAAALRAAGYDTCSTASNHTLDAGEPGVYRTLHVLDQAGLRHVGSARSAAERDTPTIVEVRGVKVAHLSYTSGFNGLRRPVGKPWVANLIDPVAILAEARRARAAGAEIVVVSLHWGNEYDHRPSAAQVTLARRLTATPAVVDLILGSHAHVVQPVQQVNGVWVAYGMGNHLARQADGYPSRREGIMPRFTFTERGGRWVISRVEPIPTWIEFAPRIRTVNLATAFDDPTIPAATRAVYAVARIHIAAHIRALDETAPRPSVVTNLGRGGRQHVVGTNDPAPIGQPAVSLEYGRSRVWT
jgi:poly-gamma-glutamate synthesis protein (capsule biosynthesis protein)